MPGLHGRMGLQGTRAAGAVRAVRAGAAAHRIERGGAVMANKRVKPDTPEYRRWQAAWIALLACAFCIGVFMFLSRPYLPDAAFFALFVAANLMVFAAILINGVKMTRLREDCERRQRKSKASRAEEKRRRAKERERDKARLAGMAEMDESAMTLKEKLQHRARLSAERANIKGSGL